jgi:HK97 family phage prohead protease
MDRINFPCEFKFAGDDAPGTVEGYASVFGALDQGGDMVMAGAFKSSIADWKKRGQLVPMLWQHDPDEPIGVWPELQEDDKGLRVKGELILDVPQAKAARALMRAGAVTGLSIGYQTKYAELRAARVDVVADGNGRSTATRGEGALLRLIENHLAAVHERQRRRAGRTGYDAAIGEAWAIEGAPAGDDALPGAAEQ